MKWFSLFLICFITSLTFISFGQDFEWARRAGDNNHLNNFGNAITIDHRHNIIVAGRYADNCLFGGTLLNAVGIYGGFIAKYDSLGDLVWAKSLSGDNADECTAIAVDAFDNIFVAGNMHSLVLHLGPSDTLKNWNPNGYNGFIARFDSTGNFQWANGIHSYTTDSKVTSLTVDNTGDPVICGSFINNVNISGTELAGGSSNCFFAKYASSGSLLWCRAGKSNSNNLVTSVTTDNTGKIYGTGKISGDIAFNTAQVGNTLDAIFDSTALPAGLYDYFGTCTTSYSGAYMQVSGGNNSLYTNFLYQDHYSNLEYFKVESGLKVIAGGDGVGLGKFAGISLIAQFSLTVSDTNSFSILDAGTPYAVSPSYSIAVGDSIHISIERSYDTVSAVLVNYTQHYAVVKGFRILVGPPVTTAYLPNNGFFWMYFLGGTQNIYTFKISSTENYNPLTVFAGNSITIGYYSGGKGHRFSDLVYNNSPYIYDVDAGAGDLSANLESDTAEIINLHPKYVFMEIGTNDAARGVDTLTYLANITAIAKAFKVHGIIPVLGTLVPYADSLVFPYLRQIRSLAAADTLTVVDIWSALVDPATGYMQAIYNSGDYVHPNPAGNIKMAQTIAAQAPFLLTDTTEWNAAHGVTTLPPGNDRIFITKFDPSGNFLWTVTDTSATAPGTSPTNNYTCANSIAADNSGNLYIGGNLLDALFTAGYTHVVMQDAFIAKYAAADGTPLWHKRFGGNTNDGATGLAIDQEGFPYVIGNYGGDLSLDTFHISPSDYQDLFIAKFDAGGNTSWITDAAGHLNFGIGIAVDPNGSIATTGGFNNSATFDTITLSSVLPSSVYNYDIFVARQSPYHYKPPLNVALSQNNDVFNISPNPANNHLTVIFNSQLPHTICIRDMLGIARYTIVISASSLDIDLSIFSTGMYYISVTDLNIGVATKKFIKM